ncbi:MAG TPA: hypothetical protein VGG28_05340 [Kofleriaceae bacterium]|jgi:hypothetical protein
MRALAGFVVVAVACRSPSPPPPPPAPAAVARAPALVAVDPVARELAALSVTDDDFYRPVLYTWTTADSVAKLRKTRQLLVATIATGGFVSPYLRALIAIARRGGTGGDVARMLLTNAQLLRRRYAWPAPFATVLGLGPRTYGSELIRIELDRDAWIGRFEPSAADPFRFVDATNAEVPLGDVLAHPERIGAMFHVQRGAAVPFREFVICNPAMVASWQVATPAVDAELAAERTMLEALARRAGTTRESSVTADWTSRSTSGRDWIHAWHAALAFDNARYRPTPETLDALAKALSAPAGAALTGP